MTTAVPGRDPLDVVGTGSMVVDVIARVPELGQGDGKVLIAADEGPAVQRLVGGVALNHLGWAAVLGLRTGIFGLQADDEDGRLLRRGMAALGIESRIELSGSHSSFAHVYVDPEGERMIYMARGATGEFTPAHVDAHFVELIGRARLVTSEVSQVPLATVLRVFEHANRSGAVTVLDLDVPPSMAVPGLGTRDELEAVLSAARILKPSGAAAAELVATAGDPEQTAGALADRYDFELVALTSGSEGSLVLTAERVVRAPACSVRSVDSTGAGDAFLGGLLVGLARGLDAEETALLANASGAACCEQLGAFPVEPDRSRTRVLQHFAAAGGDPDRIAVPA